MSIAFTDAALVVGDGRVIENGTIVVENGLIKEVVSGRPELGPEVELRSVAGRTILPGLIDCHIHICMYGGPDPLVEAAGMRPGMVALKSAAAARDTLLAGFTAIRDMGGKDGVDLDLRDAIATGLIPGPRMQVSANVITMTGGHGWMIGREADGPDDVRKAAREQIKAGADLVKLMASGGVMTPGVEPGSAQLTEDELRAGVEEAHKAGRRTATHAQGSTAIMNALKAGLDSIEHGFYLTDEIVEFMVEHDRALVPTLSAIYFIVENGLAAGIPQFAVDKAKRVQEAHVASLNLAKKAGVLVAMGTDAGTPFNLHGLNGRELKLMVDSGAYTPLEAIIATTLNGAKVMGLADRIGTLEAGKEADLIIVEGDPLADIGLLAGPDKIGLVMKAGEIAKDCLQ